MSEGEVLTQLVEDDLLDNPFSSTEADQDPRELGLRPWRFFLGLSSDMTILGELKRAKSRQLTVDNNKSGTAGFVHTMDHQMASLIRPWRTCVIAQRGYHDEAEWFWSGPISNVVRDYAAGTVNVDAVGWFELLVKRLILARSIYAAGVAPRTGEAVHSAAWDAAEIAFDLLAYTNAQRDTHISAGISEVSQPRTRTYEVDTAVGPEIQSLAELESGYDWYVDPRTRELNIVARRGQDRTNCKWLFIADDSANKGNLRNVVETEDGSTLVNDELVRGKFSTARAQALESQEFYDVLAQEAVSLSDVADSDILNAYANAEIVYKQNPRKTYALSPKPHIAPGVPVLFEDYDIGDTTYLTARRGEFSIEDQAIRVFGATMQIDDFGVETITDLKTSPD